MLKIAIKIQFFLLAIALSSPLLANSIRVQGRLTDREGNPRKSATAKLKIELFPVAEGGGFPLWIKEYEQVHTNEAGLFSLDIGEFELDFFNKNPILFLQISVDDFGYQVLKPRQKISTVPLAIGAEYSNTSKTSLSVGTGAVSSSSIQDNAIKAYHIGPGEIHGVHIATGTLKKEHLEDESISTEKLENQAVTKIKLSSASVGADQLEDGSITKKKMGFKFTTMRYLDTKWLQGEAPCSGGILKNTVVIPLEKPLEGFAQGFIGEIDVKFGRFNVIRPDFTPNHLRVYYEVEPFCPNHETSGAMYKALVHFYEIVPN